MAELPNTRILVKHFYQGSDTFFFYFSWKGTFKDRKRTLYEKNSQDKLLEIRGAAIASGFVFDFHMAPKGLNSKNTVCDFWNLINYIYF